MNYKIKYGKYLTHILIWVISLVIIAVFFKYLLPLCVPLILGWLIATTVNPLVRFLETKLSIKRKFGSLIIILTILGLSGGILYYIIAKTFIEFMAFIEQLPNMLSSLPNYFDSIDEVGVNLLESIPKQHRASILDSIQNMSGAILGFTQNFAKGIVEKLGNFASFLPISLVTTIVTLLISYFLLVDRDKIIKYISKHTPRQIKNFVNKYSSSFNGIVSGYFYAQFKIMFWIALIVLVGLLILKVKFAIPIALLIAFLDFFPFLGTGFVIWPWTVIELIAGDYFRATGLLVIYAVTQLFRRIIEPKILGDSIGINPMIALILMFVGYKVSNLFGVIIAVPIGMLVINLNNAGLFDDLKFIFKDVCNDIMTFANIERYKNK